MSVTLEEVGFGGYPFGTEEFGAGIVYAHSGLQFEAVIQEYPDPEGVEFESQILNFLDPEGVEFESKIVDFEDPEGVQFESLIVDYADPEGLEFESLIPDYLDPEGVEFESLIVDFTDPEGLEFESLIPDFLDPEGLEFESLIPDYLDPEGLQFQSLIPDFLDPEGVEFEATLIFPVSEAFEFHSTVIDYADARGVQFFATNLGFSCVGFGGYDFGTLPFGSNICSASAGMEFTSLIPDFLDPEGVEFESKIVDYVDPEGIEFEIFISNSDPEGIEFASLIPDFNNEQGLQFESVITDNPDPEGIEFEGTIDRADPEGLEFIVGVSKNEGMEFRVNLYNTTQIRVMCDFPSRGIASGVGNNSWGNPIASGQSWKTNSQDPSPDYTVQNLNTDIVEQVYRSQTGTVSGLNLDCDVEQSPGTFMDTFAILNHNMTTGATITLIASDDSAFSVIQKTINIQPRLNNIYYIEPELPLTAYRYWRLQIDDVNNTDNYIEIGTIIFGSAIIFTQDECMTDRITKRTTHYYDSVKTEGFSAVKNDRTVKTRINLRFESLQFNKGNYQNLASIFQYARTSLKCLWIPTPSTTDPAITERFAVFGKLPQIPEEEHNVKGSANSDLDFISLNVEVDEAE